MTPTDPVLCHHARVRKVGRRIVADKEGLLQMVECRDCGARWTVRLR